MTSTELTLLSQEIIKNPQIAPSIPIVPQELVLPRPAPEQREVHSPPQEPAQGQSHGLSLLAEVASTQEHAPEQIPRATPRPTSPRTPMPENTKPMEPSEPQDLSLPRSQDNGLFRVPKIPAKRPLMVDQQTQVSPTDLEPPLSRRKRRALNASQASPLSHTKTGDQTVQLPLSWMGDMLKALNAAQTQVTKMATHRPLPMGLPYSPKEVLDSYLARQVTHPVVPKKHPQGRKQLKKKESNNSETQNGHKTPIKIRLKAKLAQTAPELTRTTSAPPTPTGAQTLGNRPVGSKILETQLRKPRREHWVVQSIEGDRQTPPPQEQPRSPTLPLPASREDQEEQ